MDINKIYKPIMPLKKLRKGMTVITPKNAEIIKARINKFLSKPCMNLTGYMQDPEMRVPVIRDGITLGYANTSEKYIPRYIPFEGKCEDHFLFRNNNGYHNDPPRLQITNFFGTSCIPIHYGDKFKLFGDRLVIYHKYNKYTAKTPWMRYTDFVHKKELDPVNIKYMKMNGRMSQIFDEFMYYGKEPEGLPSRVKSINDANDLMQVVDDAARVANCKLREVARHSDVCDPSIKTVEIPAMHGYSNALDVDMVKAYSIEVNIQHFFDAKYDNAKDWITFSGINNSGEWSCSDFYSALINATEDWISAANEVYEERNVAIADGAIEDHQNSMYEDNDEETGGHENLVR